MIGQEVAKKLLSVAVYNHYKRLNNNLTSNNSGVNNSSLELVMDDIRRNKDETEEERTAISNGNENIYIYIYVHSNESDCCMYL